MACINCSHTMPYLDHSVEQLLRHPGALFHPSLLFAVPEELRRLQDRNVGVAEVWRRFSQEFGPVEDIIFHFLGVFGGAGKSKLTIVCVKTLHIYLSHVPLRKCQTLKTARDLTTPRRRKFTATDDTCTEA